MSVNFLDPRLPMRFWDKCIPEPMSGCWLAIGSHTHDGYGRYSINSVVKLMHRVAYDALAGQVPDGLVLDHLCRTRCCCNPSHLEPVTIKVNQERGVFFNSLKTACRHGHDFITHGYAHIRKSNGRPHRGCRACDRANQARRYATKTSQRRNENQP